jgi:hypothetical protein
MIVREGQKISEIDGKSWNHFTGKGTGFLSNLSTVLGIFLCVVFLVWSLLLEN